MTDPTPDEQRILRLSSALAEHASELHGPALQRIAATVIDDLRPHVAEDLLRILESPAYRQRLLEQRLRDERYSPTDTTTVEGLTRAAHDRAGVLEDLAARRVNR
jgi:hypothetical protein